MLDHSTTTPVHLTLGLTSAVEPSDAEYGEGKVGAAIRAANLTFVSSGGDVDALDFSRDDPITIAGWMKKEVVTGLGPSGTDGHELILASKMGDGADAEPFRGWWVFSDRQGNIDFLNRNSNVTANRLIIETTTPQFITTDWYHVAVTFEHQLPEDDFSRGVHIYVNGEEVETRPTSGYNGMEQNPPLPTTNNASFNIGGRDDDNTLAGGWLDEVAVWNRILSPAEIVSLSSTTPVVEGDLNGDGYVNLLDLALFQAHFGDTGDLDVFGDFDGNQDVGRSDLAYLAARYGTSSPAMAPTPTAVAVPEPSAATLGLFAAATFAACLKRRRLDRRCRFPFD